MIMSSLVFLGVKNKTLCDSSDEKQNCSSAANRRLEYVSYRLRRHGKQIVMKK